VSGRFHFSVSVGDKRAVADYRDPIVAKFHAIHRAREAGQPPPAADLEAVIAWLGQNQAQAALCASGECDHAA
jgi:hypothetical protein